ncbi:MAG: terminase large subunit domain-containing protein, partial [Schleiferiaceae bacterium]
GPCLDKPTARGTRCDESVESLRDRIYARLLEPQRQFVDDVDHKILGYCAGFGAGKTYALCAKTIFLGMANPNTVAAVFEPTNIMLRDVWMRAFDEFLDEFGIEHDFRVSPQPEYVLHLPLGPVTLLCRATETFNRIRGQNLSFCLADEIDTSPAETAQKASEMMLARLRGGAKPQLAVASTPEGFKWMHRTFVEQPGEDRHLIRARTTDNPHLPPGFIDSLYANYPPQLIASYINGEFTNLANANVYPYFDRDLHWCDTQLEPDDRIFVGIDFNVGACFMEVMVRRGDEFHFIAEHHAADTPSVVRKLQEQYPEQLANNNLVVVPDAASRQRSTTNAKESDLSLLRKGGFTLKTQLANPAIEDRVNAINVLLLAKRMRVSNKCKYLLRSLETQAFDKQGKPEKGIGGLDDKSGPADAAGYVITALAGLRRYATGGSHFRTY